MFLGAMLAWFLVDSRHVLRSDGSRVIVMKHPTWRSEAVRLCTVLRTDAYIVLLFPMFFASNWFYTYQFNDVNLARFNIRTRALNNLLYWLSQILGAYVFGYALDVSRVRRPMRARVALVALFVLTMAVWGGGYAWQRGYTRATDAPKVGSKIDWTSRGYMGPMFLFMFYGFYDAAWQTCVYWSVSVCVSFAPLTWSTQVSWRPDKQRAQDGALCRLLQGHPERGRGHCISHRRAWLSVHEHICELLGSVGRQRGARRARRLFENSGPRVGRGGLDVF